MSYAISLGKSILLVDDDELLLETFRMFLEMEGYDVIVAFTPYKALQMIENTPIELAILDYNLPNMNGVQLGRLIHKVQEKASIMFISGNPDIYELVKEANYSVSAVLTKPIEVEHLTTTVRKITGATNSKEQIKTVETNMMKTLVRCFSLSTNVISKNNFNFGTLS